MIGDKTLFEYLFQFTVILQPLFWVWLYDSRYNFKEKHGSILYIFSAFTVFLVQGFNVNIGFYNKWILTQYIVIISLSYYLYRTRNPVKEALSLAFLTVFFNSFFWELSLHLAEILQFGLYPAMIIQYWRIYPGYWIWKHYTFTATGKRQIILAQLFTVLIIMYRHSRPPFDARMLYFFNKLITMTILTKTITEAEKINQDN